MTVLTHLKAWEDEEFAIKRLGLDTPLGSIDRSRLNVNDRPWPRATLRRDRWARSPPASAALEKREATEACPRPPSICAAGGQGVVAILEA